MQGRPPLDDLWDRSHREVQTLFEDVGAWLWAAERSKVKKRWEELHQALERSRLAEERTSACCEEAQHEAKEICKSAAAEVKDPCKHDRGSGRDLGGGMAWAPIYSGCPTPAAARDEAWREAAQILADEG
jgi:hypothetical protein